MNCYDDIIKTYTQKGNTYNFYYFNSKTTIKDFILHIDTLADFFLKNGIKKGDVFTIYLPNCLQSFATFYALNKIGAISNVVHPLTPLSTLSQLQAETGSKGIIVLDILVKNNVKEFNKLNTKIIIAKNSNHIKGLKGLAFKLYEAWVFLRRTRKLNVWAKYSKIIKNKKVQPTLSESDGKNVAVYIHSGGTTGIVKTIKLSNSAIVNLSNQLSDIDTNPAQNKFAPIVLPIFHAYGLAINMHAAIVQGYNSVVFPRFNARAINNCIRKRNVTMIVSVPLMISKLMQDKRFYGKHLQKLRTVYCGGDTVGNTLQNNFNEAIEKHGGKAKLFAGYGLTESSSVVSTNTLQDYKFGSVGKALKGNDIQIWDEENKALKADHIGEIVVSGPTIMNGYLNSEDNGLQEVGGKKWVKTGDLGFIDKEGYVYIVGRKKRLIKIASYNVFPSQIEEVVSELEFVDEVCAIESHKNEKKIVKLVVSLKDKSMLHEQASKLIFEHCSRNLIKYSVPTELQIIDVLPHTALSKIDFVKIEKLYG